MERVVFLQQSISVVRTDVSTGQEGTPVCWCQTEKTLQATGAEFNCIQVTEITLINSM